MINPGPFTVWKRPRKNITPRSYSFRILIVLYMMMTNSDKQSPSVANYIGVSFVIFKFEILSRLNEIDVPVLLLK